MKSLAIALYLTMTATVYGCPKGESVWQDGCVVDISPQIAPPVQPSDEKPPSDKMPSYQREGVKLIDPPNMTSEDAKNDADKRNADTEGKKAAGIPNGY